MTRRYALALLLLPAFLLPASAQTGVTAVLPNGREIHPAGNWISLAPYPFALAVRPDGAQIAVPSIGFPFALNVVADPASSAPTVQRMPSGEENDPAIETHAGLAYSPDGALLYVATGDSGKIRAYHVSDWKPAGELSLDGPTESKDYSGSFAATLVLSADGKTIYALDQGNWRVVIIDAASMQRIASIETGTYPFGLALSPDGTRLYVTNTGLFEYTTVPGADKDNPLGTGLHFPPFGYPSQAARQGVTIEGKKIPGLGDENSTRGSSLWTYDIRDREHPAIAAKLRLGTKIVETRGETVGGAAPTGIAASTDAIYVSLAHEDAIAKITPDGAQLLTQTTLSPFTGSRFQDAQGRPLRGVMPSGLAIHDDRVYVAESGIDAVGVLDTSAMQIVSHIPVGWNPSALAFSPDGKTLYVVNTKGKGAGPNAGAGHDPKTPTYVGSLEYGSLSAIPLDSLPSAEESTKAVVAANTADIANRPPLPHLKHCFLVIRENRTYDEVLGDVAGANGDPSLARFGLDGWTEENATVRRAHSATLTGPRSVPRQSLTHLQITPNLHALVARYAMSDNFYVDSDVSADGHRWVMGINPTPFFNTAWSSGYGGRRHDFPGSPQPGRRALFGGADAPMPEDEPQFGSLWEHIAASGKGILNYGEGLEIEGNAELPGSQPEGQRLFLNSPLPEPVFEATDHRYPTFNLGIPDQFRFEEFARDFTRKLAMGKVPALIVIRLPNDHTMEPRPADGYPFRASYVADNDLALGRIVAFLSKISIWKDSALFVTEDDAQSGVDHVDAHRSILLVASPWVKPGAVSHQHSSMGSITRTIDELLDLGSLNLEDALAGEISGIFDTQPHVDPFTAKPSDPRVFVAAKARFAKPKTKEEAAELRDVDDSDEIRKQMEKSAPHLHRPSDTD
jgi:YVTN family beta-propeller protein